jgi:hypothetical protein
MTDKLIELPSGHILLTPDIITAEFLAYLESAGIPDPGDDLDFVIITDADRLELATDDTNADGSHPWALPWDDQLSRSINQSFFVDWHKIEFADGLKAVGICSH